MMKAVWSFWTKPYVLVRRSIWTSEMHHLLSWMLSFYTARRHFPQTALCTDDDGARLLVDGLGIEFSEVSTELNILQDRDPSWWALGKIYTYGLQTRPFVHIDSDVYLWKRPILDPGAPVVAQNPEHFTPGASYYMPERFESVVRQTPGGWLPPEWQWYRSSGFAQRAESCGIFGGTHTDFIRYYARIAARLIEHRANQGAWRMLGGEVERNILAEQYLLSACLEYHRSHENSPYRGLAIQYLFDSMDAAFNPAKAAEMGYTHLIAGSKRDARVAENLEKRVRTDYPEQYERCLRHLRGHVIEADRPRNV